MFSYFGNVWNPYILEISCKFHQLNEDDEQARQFLYTEIPYHYVFNTGTCQWKCRKKGANKIIPQNGQVFDTFQKATDKHNLLSNDNEWMRCLGKAAGVDMTSQLRQTYALIIRQDIVYSIPESLNIDGNVL